MGCCRLRAEAPVTCWKILTYSIKYAAMGIADPEVPQSKMAHAYCEESRVGGQGVLQRAVTGTAATNDSALTCLRLCANADGTH